MLRKRLVCIQTFSRLGAARCRLHSMQLHHSRGDIVGLQGRGAAKPAYILRLHQAGRVLCSRHKQCARLAAKQPERWSALDSDDYDDGDATVTAAKADAGVNQETADTSSDVDQQPAHEQEDPAAGKPGGGLVGLFVAGWMAVLSIILQLLSPVFSLGLFVAQPLTQTNPVRARAKLDKWVTHLPQGFWARLHYIWERPLVKSIRITASIANWSVRLPAIAALLLAQGGAMASTISFPMLAPLLLGTGMMMNSIKANASFIIPRLGLMVVLLWVLWFFTNVIQTTWVVLCKQGRIDLRTLAGARMITECTSLLLAGIVVLSMLGINISALLLPAGVVLAIASRDLLQNFIAGFFLVLAQPFRLGDKVAVSCSAPGVGLLSSAAAAAVGTPSGTTAAAAATTTSSSYSTMHSASAGERSTGAAAGSSSSSSMPAGWFEGICEKVDLRYTVLRDGRRRLMVPNTAFVSGEFLVYDEGPEAIKPAGSSSSSSSSSSWWWQHKSTSTGQDQAAAAAVAAGQPGSSGNSPRGQQQQQPADRQQTRSPVPEPAIVEGHMTTQLPPLGAPGIAQPIYPGMHFVAAPHPGYHSPFPHMHYQQQPMQGWGMDQQQPVPGWGMDPFQDPFFNPQQGWGIDQQQPQQQQEQASHDWQQHQQQQHQQEDGNQVSSQQDPKQQHRTPQQGEEGEPQQQRRSRPVAKGPPGYLPQGFAAAPPYYGIPVGTLYYGVPGVMPWPTTATPGQPNASRPVQQGADVAATSQGHGAQQRQQQHRRQQQQQQPDTGRNQEGSSGDWHGDDPGAGPEASSSEGGVGAGENGSSGGGGGGGSDTEAHSGYESTPTATVPGGSQQYHHQQQQYSQASQPSSSRNNSSYQAGSGRGFSHQPPPQAVQQQQRHEVHARRESEQTHRQQQTGAAGGLRSKSGAAAHTMHMAAGAGFGMWGVVPPPGMQPWEQSGSMQYPRQVGLMPPPAHVDQSTHHVPSSGMWASYAPGGGEDLHPHQKQLLQQQQQYQYQQDRSHQALHATAPSGMDWCVASHVAGEGVEGPAAVAGPGSVPQGEDYSQGSNLVMAVLQEFTKQQF